MRSSQAKQEKAPEHRRVIEQRVLKPIKDLFDKSVEMRKALGDLAYKKTQLDIQMVAASKQIEMLENQMGEKVNEIGIQNMFSEIDLETGEVLREMSASDHKEGLRQLAEKKAASKKSNLEKLTK